MRISDWSSDVCSSDLVGRQRLPGARFEHAHQHAIGRFARIAATHHGLRLGRKPPSISAIASGFSVAAAIPALLTAPGIPQITQLSGACAKMVPPAAFSRAAPFAPSRRSEEHTSELQSLMRISYAVFCLKKKNNQTHITNKL